jgi:hypothetical protein
VERRYNGKMGLWGFPTFPFFYLSGRVMLTLNLEVRLANTMKGVMEYSQVTKQEALLDGIDLGLSAYFQINPKAKNKRYQIVPSKEWNDLTKRLYFFRETPDSEFGLCKIVRKKVLFPTAVSIPIYVIFEPGVVEKPIEINVMPTMSDVFKT